MPSNNNSNSYKLVHTEDRLFKVNLGNKEKVNVIHCDSGYITVTEGCQSIVTVYLDEDVRVY